MPLMLALGGAGAAVKGGGKVATQVVDTVKAVLTRSELSEMAKLIETDSALGKHPPRDAKALRSYIGENVRARSGRDPADDLWGNAFRIVRQGRERVLLSTGPNGTRDRCAGDAIGEGKRAQRAVRAELDGAAQEGATRDDDICVELHLVTGGSKKGDRLPFRQIR